MMLGQEARQTTSNIGHLNKPSIQALIHGLNRHYYSIAISYRSACRQCGILQEMQRLLACCFTAGSRPWAYAPLCSACAHSISFMFM